MCDRTGLSDAIIVRFSLPDANPAHVRTVVCGFDARYHCQRCLRGIISDRIKTHSTPTQKHILLNEARVFDALYICGVARGRVKERLVNNLHLPLESSPGLYFEYNTYNEFMVHIMNAWILAIPELPDGYMGLPQVFARCCNYRFGVSRFGVPNWDMEKNEI
jgi:hypothetical protein